MFRFPPLCHKTWLLPFSWHGETSAIGMFGFWCRVILLLCACFLAESWMLASISYEKKVMYVTQSVLYVTQSQKQAKFISAGILKSQLCLAASCYILPFMQFRFIVKKTCFLSYCTPVLGLVVFGWYFEAQEDHILLPSVSAGSPKSLEGLRISLPTTSDCKTKHSLCTSHYNLWTGIVEFPGFRSSLRQNGRFKGVTT